LCLHDHLLKHRGGWQLHQPYPGYFTWTSPFGRTYHVTPTPVIEPLIDPNPHPDPPPPVELPPDADRDSDILPLPPAPPQPPARPPPAIDDPPPF
jgi:hypothetical protein